MKLTARGSSVEIPKREGTAPLVLDRPDVAQSTRGRPRLSPLVGIAERDRMTFAGDRQAQVAVHRIAVEAAPEIIAQDDRAQPAPDARVNTSPEIDPRLVWGCCRPG